MHSADDAFGINEHLGWHPTELEEFDFLAVAFGDRIFGIGQTDKRNGFLFPVFPESCLFFRADDQNFDVLFRQLVRFIAQLRHVPSAERSNKTPVENKQDVSFASELRKRDELPMNIRQIEIRRDFVRAYTHEYAPYYLVLTHCTIAGAFLFHKKRNLHVPKLEKAFGNHSAPPTLKCRLTMQIKPGERHQSFCKEKCVHTFRLFSSPPGPSEAYVGLAIRYSSSGLT